MKTTEEHISSARPDGHCNECGQEVPPLFRVCVDCSKLNVTQKLTLKLSSRTSKGWS